MEKITPPTLGKRFLSELVGTYILVAFTIVAYFFTLLSGGNSLVYGITYGATLTILITVFRQWSYQFNPIVSLMAFLMRGQNLAHTVGAILAQLIGAVLASQTVAVITTLVPGVEAQVPALDSAGVSMATITTLEGFGIFLLLMVYVWGATKKDNLLFPILAGLSVIPGSLVAVFVTGAALNPIRILGPAILAKGAFATHWVYWVGPLIAALVVAVIMGILLKGEKKS